MTKKFFLIFGLLIFTTGLARPQTVNCLVAYVNGQALTLTDLQIAQEFGLFTREGEGQTGDPRLAALDALIDQKVVLEVTREPMAVGKDELSQTLAAVRGKLGPDVFRSKLRSFGLTEDDLRPYLEDRIRFERIVSARFATAIPVPRSDAEKFYREVYGPEQRAKGLEPETLESVISDLETRIRENLRARKVAEWIRNVRNQAEVRINRDCLK
jgi:hypothetical protein